METFPLDCRRQLAFWLLHKGNTRLGKERRKAKNNKPNKKEEYVKGEKRNLVLA